MTLMPESMRRLKLEATAALEAETKGKGSKQ